jgi:hypothetical protein
MAAKRTLIVMDDATFLERFELCQFAPDDWGHRDHIKVAYLYLRRMPPEAAVSRMREGLKALQAAFQVPDALDRGYHETMTQVWMRLVEFALRQFGATASADEFYESHPELWQSKVLRFFYSADRLLSAQAKAAFIEPDILPLPVARESKR